MKVGGGAAAIVYNSRPVLGAILLPAIGLHAIGGRNYGVTDLNGQNLVNIFSADWLKFKFELRHLSYAFGK